VNLESAGGSRRWRSAVAIVAAASLFIALIAGSSLRPQFAAAELPEPAAWSHASAHAGHVRLHAAAPSVSQLEQGSAVGSTPIKKKPFHSMWMTRDRPTTWHHSSTHSGWTGLPKSFAASEFKSGAAQSATFATAPGSRNILTQLCVARC